MQILFRLFLWPQRLLLLGPGFDTGFHRHHAAQLCVGLEGALRLREAPDAPWRSGAGFFVAPDQPHQFDAGGANAILYLDPESSECARCVQQHAAQPVARLPALAASEVLRQLLTQGGDERDAGLALRLLLGDVATAPEPRALNPRLLATLEWIGAHIGGPIRQVELARAMHLSESRLAHLFSAQIGVPLRRYVLWRRLRIATERAIRGESLTAAAHAAGFADSAHLSRSFRAHFGVAPSFLFEHRARIELRICGDAA